jgi:hypothetical protein
MYLLVYVHRPDAIDGDATLAVAVSLIQHGTPDIAALGASEGLLPGLSRMGSFGADGHLYSKKGVTPSLFLLPFVLIAQAAPWLTIRATAMLFNPVVTALTAVVLYSFLVDAKFSPRTAWRTALLYGVATFAISYTRTLFGEPLAALLLLWAVVATPIFWGRVGIGVVRGHQFIVCGHAGVGSDFCHCYALWGCQNAGGFVLTAPFWVEAMRLFIAGAAVWRLFAGV